MKITSKQLGRAVFAVIAISLGFAATELSRRLEGRSLALHWGYLSASMLALACGYVALGLAFARVLNKESHEKHARLAVLELSFRGLLARYLPGKVGVPAVRMAAAAEFSVSVPFMAGTVIMETLASVATAGVVVAFLSIGPWAAPLLRAVTTGAWSLPVVLALVVGVAVLALLDVRRYPRRFVRLFRASERTGPLLSADWLVGCTLNWLAVAAASALVALSLSQNIDVALLAAAAGVLGPIAGLLSVVAPAGLGVREAFMVALLSPQMGATEALALSLVSRAVMLATEVSLWLVTRAVLEVHRRDR